MKQPMVTSLTFQDQNAENAMNFYVALFENSRILSVTRWGAGGPVKEGLIMQASFELDGNLFMCRYLVVVWPDFYGCASGSSYPPTYTAALDVSGWSRLQWSSNRKWTCFNSETLATQW